MCIKCFNCLKQTFKRSHCQKWQSYLNSFCTANAHKYPWCQLFLDNYELINQHVSLSKELSFQIRNTNISSQIVKIIEKHYASESNILKCCVQLFGSFAKLKYSDVINPSKITISKLSNDYQEFIGFVKDLFVLYYELQDRQIVGEELFYNITLPHLAISFIFGNQDFSSTVHKVIRTCLKQMLNKINFYIHKNSGVTIFDCGVKQQFMLNEMTLKHFSIMEGNLNYEKAYMGSIQMIKQITHELSPPYKLILIESLKKQIQTAILNFYKRYNIKKYELQLDQDSLTSILLYIIIQANQANLMMHIQMINYFNYRQHAINNNAFPCLTSLISCFQLIQKGTIKRQQLNHYILFVEEEQFNYNNLDSTNYFNQVSTFDL